MTLRAASASLSYASTAKVCAAAEHKNTAACGIADTTDGPTECSFIFPR